MYSHGDYRTNFDVFRHEIFHAIEAEREIRDMTFFNKISSLIGEHEADVELKKVSPYAFEAKEGEAEAECFAKITSPDYDDSIRKEIEQVVERDAKGDER